MDNNFNFNSSNANKPSVLDWIGLGCAAFGCLLVVIFNMVTCSRTAKVMIEDEKNLSLAVIGSVIGAIIAIAGAVLVIISAMQAGGIAQIGMIGKIVIVVAIVAVLFAIVPNVTICSYNSNLKSS